MRVESIRLIVFAVCYAVVVRVRVISAKGILSDFVPLGSYYSVIVILHLVAFVAKCRQVTGVIAATILQRDTVINFKADSRSAYQTPIVVSMANFAFQVA